MSNRRRSGGRIGRLGRYSNNNDFREGNHMNSTRLLAGVCAVLLPLAASAMPVTYEFSGFVNLAGGSAPPEGEMFEPIIPFATEFTGSFTIENETPITAQQPGALVYSNA